MHRNEHQFILAGTMGAGKATAMAAVSEAPSIVTDVSNTDRSGDKALATVGVDCGSLTLDDGDHLRLVGTRGQERFRFIRRVVANGASGLIVLSDHSCPAPTADLMVHPGRFAGEPTLIPCAVGIGRGDRHSQPDPDEVAVALEVRGPVFPILPLDVRRRVDGDLLINIRLSQTAADLL